MVEAIVPKDARGRFVVVDGIDGVGKGVFLDEFVACAKQDGQRVFEVDEFWKKNGCHPVQEVVEHSYLHDVIVTSEPTFIGVGKYFREVLTAKENKGKFSVQVVMEALALDRRILYEQLVLPALAAGIDVYQSRSFSTSLTYQYQMRLDEGEKVSLGDHIVNTLAIPGNTFCYAHPIDHLVIPTIADVKEAVKRAAAREKQDNSIFENLEFQLNVKRHFDADEFITLFKDCGVRLTYMDAGQTIEYSKQQAREFYVQFLR